MVQPYRETCTRWDLSRQFACLLRLASKLPFLVFLRGAVTLDSVCSAGRFSSKSRNCELLFSPEFPYFLRCHSKVRGDEREEIN